jgi:hypothetical protein
MSMTTPDTLRFRRIPLTHGSGAMPAVGLGTLIPVRLATKRARPRFRSPGDAWADTTTSHGRRILTVLDGLAEFDRDLIRARTAEGRERAEA